MIKPRFILALVLAAVTTGCTLGAKQISTDQFNELYADRKTVTDVWYMGSDSTFDYFRMEHWTIKPDGSSGQMDNQNTYKVAIAESGGVKDNFPFTTDQSKWRLLYPTRQDLKSDTYVGPPVTPFSNP
jgi:hypothetical protein